MEEERAGDQGISGTEYCAIIRYEAVVPNLYQLSSLSSDEVEMGMFAVQEATIVCAHAAFLRRLLEG